MRLQEDGGRRRGEEWREKEREGEGERRRDEMEGFRENQSKGKKG